MVYESQIRRWQTVFGIFALFIFCCCLRVNIIGESNESSSDEIKSIIDFTSDNGELTNESPTESCEVRVDWSSEVSIVSSRFGLSGVLTASTPVFAFGFFF